MIFACRSFLPPKQPSAAFCCCSIYSENSSAPVASPAIASRPHCVPKFSFAVLYSAAPDTAWSCTCPLPGAACSNASCCWKTSYSMGFQLRRSCILNPRPEPKFDQEIYMKLPSTSVFRLSFTLEVHPRRCGIPSEALLVSATAVDGSQAFDPVFLKPFSSAARGFLHSASAQRPEFCR